MSDIDKKTVRHVAVLSRLLLDEKELEKQSEQLGAILSYISKLNELDTNDVQPTSHPLSTLRNVFRKDVPKTSLTSDSALENAPQREGNFFKVPQVIEGK